MDAHGPNLPGDGSPPYPGNRAGIDGPVSSLRLEVPCDGVEDFGYLALAERDPVKFESVRRELGETIEKAQARKE